MKLILALMAVLLSGCAMQIGEGSIVRPDRAGTVLPPGRVGDGGATAYKLAPLTLAADDAQLAGVSASGEGNALTVLYFGGNGFHLDQHGDHVLAAVAPCRADVVMIDYRGYGRSTGVPTIATLKADALREFDLVNAQAPGRVIVHGQSLGSFIAAYVAQQRPAVRGLVLESTTTNARDWANNMMPWYAWPFVRVELSESLKGIDNVASASGYAGPGAGAGGRRRRCDAAAPGAQGVRRLADAVQTHGDGAGRGTQWRAVQRRGAAGLLRVRAAAGG